MYKKILIFLIILSFWFLSGIFFPIDSGFYQSLVLPIYTPSKYLFGCIWPLLYILISFSIYKIINNDNLNSDYIFILFLNYLFNQLYSMFFFYFNSLFLSLICIIVCLVTSIILFVMLQLM